MRGQALWMLTFAACAVKSGEQIDLNGDTDPVADTDPADTTPDPGGGGGDTEPPPLGELTLEFVMPPNQIELGDAAVPLALRVTGARDLASLVLLATTDTGVTLPNPQWNNNRQLWYWTLDTLPAGWHSITVDARDVEGRTGTAAWILGVCEWPPLEPFDTSVIGNGWIVFGDTHWDAQGWLEITGNAPSRAGAIYKVDRKVNPGDFRLEFDIATGGGINSGADGYSVNIIDVADEDELRRVVEGSANGGCLGYGTLTGCGTYGPVSAFHIEFDTWYNSEPFIQDPPNQENHVAINQDGDPGRHDLWATVPTLEDLQWRHVVVEAIAQRIIVSLDGAPVIDGSIPNFSFDGGYIGVSGSTGWATNFHRFDNLQIFDRCLVPGDPPLP